MRKEISEPQHWRAKSSGNSSWSSRRKSEGHTLPLAAEAVDAAFAEEDSPLQEEPGSQPDPAAPEQPSYGDLISSLTEQLELLETQRDQLQQLLAQARSEG